MKRMLGLTLLVWSVSSARAEPKLRIIDLAPDSPPTAEQTANGKRYIADQEAASKIKPAEAKDFIARLITTVDEGLGLASSGRITGVQMRNQAIALNKLQDEGTQFGTLFAPFHECNSAASDAARSWQLLIGRDVEKFSEYHAKYEESAVACVKAAG